MPLVCYVAHGLGQTEHLKRNYCVN